MTLALLASETTAKARVALSIIARAREPFVIQWKGQESLRYTYGVVRLWEIPAEQALNTTHYALWPLAALKAADESTLRSLGIRAETGALDQIRAFLKLD
jgi:hypothetical protein